mgnify:CR=1 FL=1|jgi:uncharacterized pyridoxamine 5'-phosphate oxidase family protein|tara:strand:+ start:109 stop:324 length:216 start_codon:yes stop_codon:yes gene_type:complete
MVKYKVTIEAIITKTIEVDALDLEKADEQANEMFTTNTNEVWKLFKLDASEQETVIIEKIETTCLLMNGVK